MPRIQATVADSSAKPTSASSGPTTRSQPPAGAMSPRPRVESVTRETYSASTGPVCLAGTGPEEYEKFSGMWGQ